MHLFWLYFRDILAMHGHMNVKNINTCHEGDQGGKLYKSNERQCPVICSQLTIVAVHDYVTYTSK